jgi:hypothetical protein
VIKFVSDLRQVGGYLQVLQFPPSINRNKILEKILDDLHRGNFHPIIKSEVHTPDMMELDHFEFSNISFVESCSPTIEQCFDLSCISKERICDTISDCIGAYREDEKDYQGEVYSIM